MFLLLWMAVNGCKNVTAAQPERWSMTLARDFACVWKATDNYWQPRSCGILRLRFRIKDFESVVDLGWMRGGRLLKRCCFIAFVSINSWWLKYLLLTSKHSPLNALTLTSTECAEKLLTPFQLVSKIWFDYINPSMINCD